MSRQSNGRELWIDYIKAIACLSVLTFHVIYGLQNAGLSCDAVLTNIKNICGYFQIPIFLFASGYLYGKKVWKQYENSIIKNTLDTAKEYFDFVGKKLINLGIPYVVFSAVYYFINVTFASSVNFTYTPEDLIGIYHTPLAQYWYIFATILIFVGIPLLEKLFQNEVLVLAFLVTWKFVNMYFISETNFDYYFAQYACFFYLGTLYCRHYEALSVKKTKPGAWIFSSILLAGLYVSNSFFEWGQAFDVVVLFLVVLFLFLLCVFFEKNVERCKCKFLDMVAKYSFQIYLLHTMVTAAVRIVLVKLGIYAAWPHTILGCISGLAVTMLVAYICEKTVILNIFFTPMGTVKKLKSKKISKEQ